MRTGVELLFAGFVDVDNAGVSSLPSNRFDIDPLCHVIDEEAPGR